MRKNFSGFPNTMGRKEEVTILIPSLKIVVVTCLKTRYYFNDVNVTRIMDPRRDFSLSRITFVCYVVAVT